MRLVPKSALLGASLMLLVTGCAGTARREGPSPAGGRFPVRLMRPADPIARLNPAKVSIGPMYDQGSYTAANVPEGSRIAPGGSGPLAVGVGQLAELGPDARGEINRGPASAARAQVAQVASRNDPGASRRSGSFGDRPTSPTSEGGRSLTAADWPAPEVTEDGWPLIAIAGETRPALRPETEPGDDDSSALRRTVSGDDRRIELSETVETRLDSDRLCFSEPGPRGEAPRLLVAGIDLETYAAPPVSSDPEARQASSRRPVSALRDARSSLRSEPEGGQPQPEPTPEPEPEPAEDDSFDDQLNSGVPALPDLSAFLPTFPNEPQPELDPIEGPGLDPVVEPEPAPAPARDDVRPTSAIPDMLGEEKPLPRTVERQLALDAPSPLERATLRERLGSRFRKLQDRLTPPQFRADQATSTGPESSAGQARTPRLPKLRSADDAR